MNSCAREGETPNRARPLVTVDFPISSRKLRVFFNELCIAPTLRKLHFSVLLDGSLDHIVDDEDFTTSLGAQASSGLPALEELVYYVDDDYSRQLGGLRSALSGDVKRLCACPVLRVVDLSYANVHGDLRVFACMPGLTELRLLQCGNVEGDIDCLKELKRLRILEVDGENIHGSIAALGGGSGLADLTGLNLNSTNVNGDVSGLSKLVNLTVLDLNDTQVKGAIMGLSSLTQLVELHLSRTLVEGNVAGLSELLALTVLNLSGTHAQGKATDLKKLGNLTDIRIYGTEIQDDTGEYSGDPALQAALLLAQQTPPPAPPLFN